MTLPLSQFERVSVIFEKRADGGLRVYSQDVPGFILSHINSDLVKLDVIPALETIISELVGQPVRVTLEGRRLDVSQRQLDRENIEYSAQLAA